MVSDMLRSQGNSPQKQLLDAFRIELFEDVSAMTARRKARTQRPAKNGKNEVEAPVTNGASRNTPKKTPARSRKTVPEVHDPPKRKAKTPPTEKTSKQKSTPKAENKAKANGALKPSKPDPAKPKSSTGRGKKVPKTHADKAVSQSEEADEASGGPSSTSSTMSSSTTLTSLTSSTTSSSKKSAIQKQKDQKDPKDSGQSKKRKAPSSKDSSETEEKTEKKKVQRRKRPISSESEDWFLHSSAQVCKGFPRSMWNWYSMKCMKMFEGTFWMFSVWHISHRILNYPGQIHLVLHLDFCLFPFQDYPVSSRIVERHVDVVVEELKTKPKEFIRVTFRHTQTFWMHFFWGGRSRLWEVLESKAAVAMLVLMQFQSSWDSQQLWVYDSFIPIQFLCCRYSQGLKIWQALHSQQLQKCQRCQRSRQSRSRKQQWKMKRIPNCISRMSLNFQCGHRVQRSLVFEAGISWPSN